MKTRSGFILMNRTEFKTWLFKTNVNREITMVHNHHTYVPDYSHFRNDNHFDLVDQMKSFHINTRRFADIGQQITTFPDGKIIVGTRSLEVGPACIRKNNNNAVCIEHVGNFDKGEDQMTPEHIETIIWVNALLHLKFALEVNDTHNVYHHWFHLGSGERVNGGDGTKSCPGTNFFGGNTPEDAKKNFLPKVDAVLKQQPEYTAVFGVPAEKPIEFAMVRRANFLSVRKGPGTKFTKLGSLARGSLVSIFERAPRWARISTEQKWVSSYYLKTVYKGVVTDDDPKGLSIRTGPGTDYRKVDSIIKDTPVIVYEISDNNWYRISYLDLWVSGHYVELVKL